MGGTSPARIAAQADVDFWLAWSAALQSIETNRYGVEVQRFGNVTAVLAHAAPTPFFNRILGFTARDLGILPEIAAFYRERQTPWRIDVARASRVLDSRLGSGGMTVIDEQANLCLRLQGSVVKSRTDVVVEEVGLDGAEEWALLYDAAYNGADGLPGLARFRRDSLIARFGDPAWRFYSASIDGEMVGGAILFLAGKVATLGGGATLPSARGRGCQGALLRRRLADAVAAGCRYAVSRCKAGSASHRNLRRAGLEDVFTKQVWALAESAWSVPATERSSVITAA